MYDLVVLSRCYRSMSRPGVPLLLAHRFAVRHGGDAVVVRCRCGDTGPRQGCTSGWHGRRTSCGRTRAGTSARMYPEPCRSCSSTGRTLRCGAARARRGHVWGDGPRAAVRRSLTGTASAVSRCVAQTVPPLPGLAPVRVHGASVDSTTVPPRCACFRALGDDPARAMWRGATAVSRPPPAPVTDDSSVGGSDDDTPLVLGSDAHSFSNPDVVSPLKRASTRAGRSGRRRAGTDDTDEDGASGGGTGMPGTPSSKPAPGDAPGVRCAAGCVASVLGAASPARVAGLNGMACGASVDSGLSHDVGSSAVHVATVAHAWPWCPKQTPCVVTESMIRRVLVSPAFAFARLSSRVLDSTGHRCTRTRAA